MARCDWTLDKLTIKTVGTYENPVMVATVFLRSYTCNKYVVYELSGAAAEELDGAVVDMLHKVLKGLVAHYPKSAYRTELSRAEYWDRYKTEPFAP